METNPLLFCGCVNLFRKHCSMHTNNLGIFLIINCEGLVVLAEHKSGVWGCTSDEALGHLYADFREWCSSKSIRCSHRRWYAKHLHLMTSTGEKSFGWLNSKAYNARVILAWLAETCLDLYVKTIFQIPKKSCCNLEMLKHDLFLKKKHPSQDALSSRQNELLMKLPQESNDAHGLRASLWSSCIAVV